MAKFIVPLAPIVSDSRRPGLGLGLTSFGSGRKGAQASRSLSTYLQQGPGAARNDYFVVDGTFDGDGGFPSFMLLIKLLSSLI